MIKELRIAGWGLLGVGCAPGAIGGDSVLVSAVEMAACPELGGGAASATFDADARANATIGAFVQAAGDLARAAAEAEALVGAACEDMASDLGIDAATVARQPNESRTGAVCRAVTVRMDAILAQGASGSLAAQVSPPQCAARANVEASCKGQCTAAIDPGYVRANCQPGQLYGRCEGSCTGSCNGTCTGACKGQCAGSTEAGGACKGQCNGECEGSCDGDCKGGCSVEFAEPKCAVAMKPPTADARCEASCKADANLQVQCTPGAVQVDAVVNAGELPLLVATLQENLPALVLASVQYGERIASDIEVLVRTGAELPRAFGHLSARAGSCIAAAANATLRAQASIRVSVQASASISARVGSQ